MSEPYCVEDVPEEYRVQYAWYLSENATNSERTMSPAEFVAFRKSLEESGYKA